MFEALRPSPTNVKPGIHKGAAIEPLYAPVPRRDIKFEKRLQAFFYLLYQTYRLAFKKIEKNCNFLLHFT